MLIGVIANAIGATLGGIAGLFIGKIVPKKITDSITVALCLITVVLVADGVHDGSDVMITMISLVLGVVIGELLRLEERVNAFGDMIQARIDSHSKTGANNDGKPKFSEGFILTSMFLCTGAMTIMGAINAGTKGDNSIYYMKALADGLVALTFATSKGIGVPAAGASVLVIEGALTMTASVLAPYFEVAIGDMNCVGCLILLGMATNMMNITNIRVVNFIPGIFLPILLCQIM